MRSLFFLLFLGSACGVGMAQLGSDGLPATPHDAGMTGGGVPNPGTPDASTTCLQTLSAVGATVLSLTGGQRGQLTVLLRDSCAGPVRGSAVAFAFTGSTDSSADVASATTDAAGLARVLVTAGARSGAFELVASTAAGSVRFTVNVAAVADPCLDHCGNGALDCGETGLDCGGSCSACPVAMVDDAMVTVTGPGSLVCMAAGQMNVQLRNSGTTTWTTATGYRLGFVGGSGAPLLPTGTAAQLVLPQSVAPGQTVTVMASVAAPAVPASYDARFQMQKNSSAFGSIGSRPVSVTPGCAAMTGCSFPQGVPDSDFTGHATTSTSVGNTVNQVMSQLSGCPIGSDCQLTGFADAQAWFAAVTAALRSRGLCAGQHEVGSTDEIAVSDTGCTGLWYGFHAFNYGGSKVVWAPGANRGSWSITPQHCPP